jgi:hypothetical protein
VKKRDVFINCPFSEDYQDHFRAAVFTVVRSGFKPRCALESDDSSQNRFDKICEIIAECRLGMHDISKTEPDRKSKLPRFNMPLELGVYLAARKFGGPRQSRKRCIIFDRDKYRYQAFISDIAGQDIHSHSGDVRILITKLASWLRAETKDKMVPGGQVIFTEFTEFQRSLPIICRDRKLSPSELTYADYLTLATEWIAQIAAENP